MKAFGKILIANRGEIAVRILKTLNSLGIKSVIIYTSEEFNSLAVEMADEAYLLKGNTLKDTYLDIEQIIEIAKNTQVDAIHPGYGFLSENADFASACESAGIIFIGPSPDSIKLMGDKIAAREFAGNLGIPVLKSLNGSAEELERNAKKELKFPVLIKPAGGGGGKGIKVVYESNKLKNEIEASCREADNYFANSKIYLEEYINDVKHIEVQVLGDGKGNAIHLFERECSLQRRFQKIVEEAPSPALNSNQREKITKLAIKFASAAHYRNAGTVEFLMDSMKNFYFLEMNTRIQVEHPVTESITGIDIVKEQLWIAAHSSLRLKQEDIHLTGHAIELRINAEDPYNDFMPAPGKILFYNEPELNGLRIDKGFTSSVTASSQFDPMLAKFIMHADSRSKAIEKLLLALRSYIILGISTNLDYLASLLKHPGFASGSYFTHFIQNEKEYFIKQSISRQIDLPWEILAAIWVYAHSLADEKLDDNISNLNPWQDLGHWRSVPFFEFVFENKNYQFLADLSASNVSIRNKSAVTNISIIGIGNKLKFELNGINYISWIARSKDGVVFIELNGWNTNLFPSFYRDRNKFLIQDRASIENKNEIILAPMFGKIVNLKVPVMKEVKKGEVLMILESMKMENYIIAAYDGLVKMFFVKRGEQVEKDAPLLSFRALEAIDNQF